LYVSLNNNNMKEIVVDLSKYDHRFSLSNKIGRFAWNFCYWILFRPFNLRLFRSWRNLVLRIFGANISDKAHIYSSVKIWAPWNLEMGSYACLGPYVNCYNQGRITIGANTTISQKSFLCASGHDISDQKHSLILQPIITEDQVWVAADTFIGPGVKINQGAVVGARASVFKNVDSWSVVGGNPAVFIKMRKINK